jgi:hypothetical protein
MLFRIGTGSAKSCPYNCKQISHFPVYKHFALYLVTPSHSVFLKKCANYPTIHNHTDIVRPQHISAVQISHHHVGAGCTERYTG